ncbi:hypothetical protein B0H16DRAFT_1691620 [Mycena metata]|uniref:Uncharacterized protein n=1 Tax=Mycena metata TaxID=1033252 RepID=A0AAD7ITP6_9AGAR|nr:hypothetical protein B0H16DRAFT_1691620 [Mycena metata]
MPPRRQPTQAEAEPVDRAGTARSTRSGSRTTTPQDQPLRAPSHTNRRNPRTLAVDDDVQPAPGQGFAPLTALDSRQSVPAGSRSRTITPAALPAQASQPRTPPRATASNQPLQTPARIAANHLLLRLNTQASMTSPGPPLRNNSSDESEQDDDESENSEGDTSLPPRRPHVNRRRGVPFIQPFSPVNEAVAPPPGQDRSQAARATDKWTGYRIDQNNFAWAEESVLAANLKTADCQAFYGEHTQHGGFKCKLCPQPYAAASSLTTRRTHLGKAHLPEYLALIETRQLPNKLPNFLKQKREEQRARNSVRTTFSAKALEDQLLKVIVANDLSINLIDNRDFRDLLLLLRESLEDNNIPHRNTILYILVGEQQAEGRDTAVAPFLGNGAHRERDGCLKRQRGIFFGGYLRGYYGSSDMFPAFRSLNCWFPTQFR